MEFRQALVEDHSSEDETSPSTTYGAGLRIYWQEGVVGRERDVNGCLPQTAVEAILGRVKYIRKSENETLDPQCDEVIHYLEEALNSLDRLEERRIYNRRHATD